MTREAYHEPFELLSGDAKDLHRALLSLQEELDAIDWYQQRVHVCHDEELRSVLSHNMREEIEHASMLVEWLQRNQADFSAQLREYLFTRGPVVHEEGGAEQAGGEEEQAGEASSESRSPAAGQGTTGETRDETRLAAAGEASRGAAGKSPGAPAGSMPSATIGSLKGRKS